ncbi:hypothetical protein ABZ791_07490 [Streptomyces huasconensis]|uniref:Helix-turn-helix domain-containing protein n=1 Tax=Streptomyces huasconensis TaxID=1854574 RepID=A0ABV3M5B0_9ACTN
MPEKTNAPVAAECPAPACQETSASREPAGGTLGNNRSATRAKPSLCGSCVDSLRAVLYALPQLHLECGRLLTGATAPLRERITGGGRAPGIPLNTAAVEARSAMLTTLASWAGLAAEHAGRPGPERTVPALAQWLAGELPRLAAHPAAGEFSKEVHRLAAAARRVVSPGPAHRATVGSCVEPGCGGKLVALTGAGPGGLGEIRCDTEAAHSWKEYEWSLLRRRLTARGAVAAGRAGKTAPTRWLAPQDVSLLWRVPLGSVYRLAAEHNWRRERRGGRAYYDESDVRSTLDARPAARGRSGS